MGISRNLTGTPWHIEKMVREEGDPRRHRSRCRFFRKADAYCTSQRRKCPGSAHCSRYQVGSREENKEKPISIPVKQKPKEKSNETDYLEITKKSLPIGSLVRHNRYGDGKVIRYAGNDIVVEFNDVGEKTLSIESSINVLKKLDRFTLRQSLANKNRR